VDVAARSALIGMSIDAIRALLEEMASNNYYSLSERPTPKRSNGRYEVRAMIL